MRTRRRGLVGGLLLLAAAAAPSVAGAQVFLATRPEPAFTIGPLFVRATVTPALGPVPVEILWSLTIPPTRSALGLEQDLYLLWPGGVRGEEGVGDPTLAEYLQSRGFRVLRQGRLPLFDEDLYPPPGGSAGQRPIGQAAYVTFSREGLQSLGLASAATYVRIPWVPQLLNRTRLVKLRLTIDDLIRPRPASWIEETFRGRRHVLSIGFDDVREQTLFPVYLENRARAIRLAAEPSQLLVRFTEPARLRVDELFPQSAGRSPAGGGDDAEVVSLFLETAEAGTPQALTVHFGYFSRLQRWAPILIPLLFFLLGRMAGPLVERLARQLGSRVIARVHVGRRSGDAARGRQEGLILSRDALARIVPGQTTLDEVRALGRADALEEREDLRAPHRRTLVYRGRLVAPLRRRSFLWFATVSHWEIEDHEVEIAVADGRVADVQLRVRRRRADSPEAA